MQLVEKNKLRPGMVLGQNIYNARRQPVLKKGTVLDDKTITKLQQFSTLLVRIEDEVVSVRELAPPEPSPYSRRIQESPEFIKFQKHYDIELKEFQGMLNRVIEQNQDLDVEFLYNQVMGLLMDTGNNINAFEMVQNLKDYDDSTYAHSLNVGLLSNVFASWLGFKPEDQKLVTVAGILHDIGKTKMPIDIIQKPGKLSNEEYGIVKTHPELGYQILKENNLNYHICNVALMHHERYDGSGYPHGLKGKAIDYFAKVVAIVDVYDAMTSSRVYRGAMCPFDVIDIYVQEGLQKYDSECILVFLKRIADSYLNEGVRLSDGREGKIIYINSQALSRPTVLVGNEAVDLNKNKSLVIKEIL